MRIGLKWLRKGPDKNKMIPVGNKKAHVALASGQWSPSRPGRFNPSERALGHQPNKRLGEPCKRSVGFRRAKLAAVAGTLNIFQPIA